MVVKFGTHMHLSMVKKNVQCKFGEAIWIPCNVCVKFGWFLIVLSIRMTRGGAKVLTEAKMTMLVRQGKAGAHLGRQLSQWSGPLKRGDRIE